MTAGPSTPALSTSDVTDEALMEVARQAYRYSYAPYSNIHVGAALLATNGKVYQGCNIEQQNFSGTICAERAALAQAVSEGVTTFSRVAVACDSIHEMYPCGVCREVMAEFGPVDVIVETKNGNSVSTSLASLLPFHKNLTRSDIE